MASKIDTLCNQMVADANAQLDKYEKEQIKNGVKKPNSMRTFVGKSAASGLRNGEAQAKEVLAGKSWTCNSSHMTDSARHVGPKLNGTNFTEMSPLKKAVSEEDYKKFVEVYAAAMKKQGLRNFNKGADFLPNSSDPLHMELKDSRPPDNHPEVEKCRQVVEKSRQTYAKATREGKQPKDKKFEIANKTWLEAYDKAHPKPADAGAKG